jgi:hypothetical protein
MYMAKLKKMDKTHYVIRQSCLVQGRLISRDLIELGTDPGCFIVYVGGSGYYYADAVIDTLSEAGVHVDQEQLDHLFFDFLPPEIQRVIHGFDRGGRRSDPTALTANSESAAVPHSFDKRRYHYLRFGHSAQRHIHRVSEKIFHPLHAKSRDELEQYFLKEERRLAIHEQATYVSTIFDLGRFVPEPDSDNTLVEQMDTYFISRLCRLDADERFWAGLPSEGRLRDYLVKYAVIYFDLAAPRQSAWQAYVEDFINQRRAYHAPQKVRIKIEEAGRLFGLQWKVLKKLDKVALSRLYRRLALKHHPDKGGDPELFRRLTDYYKILKNK